MTEKEWMKTCKELPDNGVLQLEKDKVYNVWQDDSIYVTGYHFSNTASYEENGEGIRPVAFYCKGKKEITIDGNGATVIVHGIMTPFVFDECEDLVIKNLTIDYAHPTMSEFTVLENDGKGNCLIRIHEDCLYKVEGDKLIWVSEKNKSGTYFWKYGYRDNMCISMHKNPKTEWTQMMGRSEDCRFPCVPEFRSIEEVGDHLLKITLKDPNAFFPVGETVQTRNTVREQIGGGFQRCKNVLCENVTIHAMHGLGIVAQFCENITFRNMDVTPYRGRTIASNADFFQISGCRGKVVIEGCKVSDGHDDFVNIHGTHLKIIEKKGRKLLLRFMEPHSRGFRVMQAGDEIDAIDRKTLVPYGCAIVENVQVQNDTDMLVTTNEEFCANVGDVVENATWTPEVEIHDNYFGPSMGRGILCTTRRKVVIENNTFYKTGGCVLCIEDDCNFWYESGFTTDVTFRNNRVIGCGYGIVGKGMGGGPSPVISVNPQVIDEKFSGYVHKKIAVENNEFCDLQEESYEVHAKYVEQLIFKNNQTDKEIRLITRNVGSIEE